MRSCPQVRYVNQKHGEYQRKKAEQRNYHIQLERISLVTLRIQFVCQFFSSLKRCNKVTRSLVELGADGQPWINSTHAPILKRTHVLFDVPDPFIHFKILTYVQPKPLSSGMKCYNRLYYVIDAPAYILAPDHFTLEAVGRLQTQKR